METLTPCLVSILYRSLCSHCCDKQMTFPFLYAMISLYRIHPATCLGESCVPLQFFACRICALSRRSDQYVRHNRI